MSRPMFYVLGAINRQGTCAVITLSALSLSICLNLFAIPRWSYIGSGAITLINGTLVTLAAWYTTRRYGFPLPAARILWKPALASSIMGVAVYLLDSFSNAGLPALVLLGAAVYLAFIGILRSFTGDDWYLFKEVLRGRRRQEKAESP